ncbi:MAG: glutamine--fructose-6-phosphate transaminase (isomerizing) [Myxococcota bacterium]|nr:glutamine--fructose-6-phosphate transaminase (isomerizing) [Myxococcota bacterium]
MCGIVGYVGRREVTPILLSGLRRLEYRGYDSAGVAVAARGALRVHKRAGRIGALEESLPRRLATLRGGAGIGHTRWATHGVPNDANAHPHLDGADRFAVVHNGIVENAAALRADLTARGVELRSDTDSEVLAHLIAAAEADTLEQRVREALAAVEGTYGVVVVDAEQPDRIVAARNGSPVILGIGDKEMFVASDVAALVQHTQQVVHLDDREVAVLEASGLRTFTLDDVTTHKRPDTVSWGQESYEKGPHEHFMRKEILEQPETSARTLRGRLDAQFGTARLGGLELSARDLLEIRRVKLLGCGSAYYAGQVGAGLIESLARVPADAEPAAEFRYRNPVIEKDTLYLAISQSGETFDTLAAVQEVQRKGGRVLGVVNAVGSTIARACEGGIYVHAGPEISVTSTKTFTSTALALALFALHLGRIRDLSPADGRRLVRALERLPEQIGAILADEASIRAVAETLGRARSCFFIGRAAAYPVAREGAQKLKEVSYIHAEAYPASELKHGPLALIDRETPTVVVLPHDELLEKSLASLEEIRARGGPILGITHDGEPRVDARCDQRLVVPRSEPALDPILLAIPLQLVAYHAAVALGRDVDQPRNLAKSVTVE